MNEVLPPDTKRIPRRGLVREIVFQDVDGNTVTRYRPVALTQDEARTRRMDYYHPDFGWLIDGYKLQTDRPYQSIVEDDSVAFAHFHPEDDFPGKETK